MEVKKILLGNKILFISLLLLIVAVGIFFRNQAPTDQLGENGIGVYTIEEHEAHIARYKEFVDGVVSKADEMNAISIFANTDSYSNRNVEKTKDDFEGLRELKVENGNYNGLSSVVSLEMIDYLILIFSIVLVWNLFEDEKKELKSIFFAAPKGRGNLAVRRIVAVGVSEALFVSVLYIVLFSIAWMKYGDWNSIFSSVQSCPLFINCTFSMNVLEYMIWYVGIRIIMAWSVAVFIWMMLSISRSQILSMAILVIVIGVEAVFTVVISEQSPIIWIKYANIFQVINPGDLLYSYRNFNFAESPINCFTMLIIVTCGMGIIGGTVCILIGGFRKPFHNISKVESLILKTFNWFKQGYHRVLSKLNIIGMEFVKILIIQKGILFILVWGYILMVSVDTQPVQYMGNNQIMQQIYHEYSGPLNGKIEKYMEEQNQLLEKEDTAYEIALEDYEKGQITLEELEGKINYYTSFESLRKCIENVSNQVQYLKNLEEEKGIKGWFIDNRGYKFLLTDDGIYENAGFEPQQKRALLNIILMILLLGTIFSFEKTSGVERLLHSLPNGREYLFKKKIKLAIIFSVVICAVSYGLELYEIGTVYSLSGLQAPVQSLFAMKDFPLKINIFTFLVILELIHMIMLVALSMVVLLISTKFSGIKGCMLSFMVLCLPEIIKMLGIEWMEKISFVQPFVYVEALHKYGFWYSTIMIGLTLGIGMICYYFAKKMWCSLFRRE